MAKITYKKVLDESPNFVEINENYLIPCAEAYALSLEDEELYKTIIQQKVKIYVNSIGIHPDDWAFTKLEHNDEIVIVSCFGDDIGGIVQIVVGAAIIAAALFFPEGLLLFGTVELSAGSMLLAGTMFILSGISSLLFRPDLPSLPSYGSFGSGNKSQTYNWQGIKTSATTDTPIPVIYGVHTVGGNVISLYTQTEGTDNYLYMLLALCEGEIEGISTEADTSVVCTTSNSDNANYVTPAIKLDDQSIGNYSDVTWWYRTGTNTQTRIEDFESNRIQYTVGNEINRNPVIYSTQGTCDKIMCSLHAPSLYDASSGSFETKAITYEVYAKKQSEPDSAYVLITNRQIAGATKSPVYDSFFLDYNQNFGTTTSQVVSGGEKTALATVTGSMTSVSTNTTPITIPAGTRTIRISWYVQFMPSTFEASDSFYIMVDGVSVTYPESSEFGYRNQGSGCLPPRDVYGTFVYDLDNDGSTHTVYFIARLTQTVAACPNGQIYINLTSPISVLNEDDAEVDPGEYDIKFVRTDGGVSSSMSVSNNLILDSVTEITKEKFTYPNTALLALKIKATEQLSGSPPNVNVIVKGMKIAVPDHSGSEAFYDLYWNEDNSRWEYNSSERTWDESTFTTTKEWSDNAILCVRDLMLNERYGLGKYYNATDFYTTELVSAIKECHKEYDTLSEHYHTWNGVLETDQAALSVLLEMCDSFRCWPIWYGGKINFIMNKDDTPIHTLTMGNTYSFSQTFTSLSELPYRMIGQFTDKTNDYDMRSLIAIQTGMPELNKAREVTVGLKGLTQKERASRELKFKLNQVTNCTHGINGECGLDYIHGTAGDIINISDRLPNIGHSGRLLSYNATNATVTIDSAYNFTSTNLTASYNIKWQNSGNTFNTATLDITATGEQQQLSVKSWPANNPITNAAYTLGVSTTYTKKFRLLSVLRTEENKVQFTGVEHLSTLYTEPSVISVTDDYSTFPNTKAVPLPPASVSAVQIATDKGIGFSLFAMPDNDISTYDFIVYMAKDDGSLNGVSAQYYPIISIPMGNGNTVVYTDNNLELNKKYYFRFYSRSKLGRISASYTTTNAFIDRYSLRLPKPSGLRLKDTTYGATTFEGKDVIINWNSVGVTPFLNSLVKGYSVSIYRGSVSAANLMREKQAGSLSMSYSYEEYRDDFIKAGFSTPSATIAFVVYALGNNGTESDPSDAFYATNANPPTPTGLTATSIEDGVTFTWDSPLDADTDPNEEGYIRIDIVYYTYRTRIGSGDWSDWNKCTGTSYTRNLTMSEVATQGAGTSTIYFELKARDIFHNVSTTAASTSGVTYNSKLEFIVSPTPYLGHFTVIASAIEAISSTGGIIYLKEGTHNVEASLQIPNQNIEIIGVNRDNVIVNLPISSKGLVYRDISKKIKLDNFTITNAGTGSTSTTEMIHIATTVASSLLEFNNLTVLAKKAGAGYKLPGDTAFLLSGYQNGRVSIYNSTMKGGRYCIKNYDSYSHTYNLFMQDNEIEDFSNGIDIAYCNFYVKNNKFKNIANPSNGFNISIGLSTTSYLSDNRFEECAVLVHSGQTIITNNYVIATAGNITTGISTGGIGVAAENNNINVTGTSGTIYGIYSVDGYDTFISNNIINIDNSSPTSVNYNYGIYSDPIINKNTIVNNIINMNNNFSKDIGIRCNSTDYRGGNKVYNAGTNVLVVKS